MSGWLIAVMVVVPLVAWLAAGHLVAWRRLPAIWDRARGHWNTSDYQRTSVRWRVAGVILAGPILALSAPYTAMINNGDPAVIRRKRAEAERQVAARQAEREQRIAAREQRVADLERELGVGVDAAGDRDA